VITAAGLVNAEIEFTQEAADGLHAAIVRARKPLSAGVSGDSGTGGQACC
jgi:arsenite methyltransferase